MPSAGIGYQAHHGLSALRKYLGRAKAPQYAVHKSEQTYVRLYDATVSTAQRWYVGRLSDCREYKHLNCEIGHSRVYGLRAFLGFTLAAYLHQ